QHHNVNPASGADLYDVVLTPGTAMTLPGLRIEPIRLLHGRLPILGFRIELAREDGRPAPNQPAPLPLAWCTDVSGIPPESWPALEGLSTLVLDLLRDRSHPTHLTVDEAAGIAGRIGAARTFFIHMSHELKHSELERRLPPGMAPAWDGLILGEDFSLESDPAAAE
ncbi:MAG: MBL fold metallo-hydrolase, partial [Planctomycetota bacterium]|nr:MBL fold metallo-hydrolase [Planctomycetota bacterium]